MKADKITLNLKAQNDVRELCKTIAEKDRNNEIAVKMARDMAKASKTYGSLTPKQFGWLCNNARRNKIKLPPELSKLMANGKAFHEADQGFGTQPFNSDTGTKIFKCIRRIEKLLNERLPV